VTVEGEERKEEGKKKKLMKEDKKCEKEPQARYPSCLRQSVAPRILTYFLLFLALDCRLRQSIDQNRVVHPATSPIG
jgi:hypothetical protein